MNVYRDRLLNVCRALDESPNQSDFHMGSYGDYGARCGFLWLGRSCGTPCCALGHYAGRGDLQRSFNLDKDGTLRFGKRSIEYYSDEVLAHFGLTNEEAIELFGCQGCNDAQTPAEAIAYIRAFVNRKYPVGPGDGEAQTHARASVSEE